MAYVHVEMGVFLDSHQEATRDLSISDGALCILTFCSTPGRLCHVYTKLLRTDVRFGCVTL